MKFKCNRLAAWLIFVGALTAASIFTAVTNDATAAQATGDRIVKYTPNMPANALVGRPDSDFVELSDGRRLRVGDVRRLTATAQKMRVAPVRQLPPALTAKPAATGKRVNNAAELAAALKLPDNETVVLPSGRRVTVGQIKFVQPQVEKRLGRQLTSAPQRPGLTGPAIKISKSTTKDEWKSILQKPDGTVIESPNGTRITVGELKQALAGGKSPAGAPRKPAPGRQP